MQEGRVSISYRVRLQQATGKRSQVLSIKHILLQPLAQRLPAATRIDVSCSAVGTKIFQQQRLEHVAQFCGAHGT